MYWNIEFHMPIPKSTPFNLYMRCIETFLNCLILMPTLFLTYTWDVLKLLNFIVKIICKVFLTYTWDVLKHVFLKENPDVDFFNLYMRCIETGKSYFLTDCPWCFNLYMRCIETIYKDRQEFIDKILTYTWDVLKLTIIVFNII